MKLAAKFLVLASSLICLPGAVQAAGRVTGMVDCVVQPEATGEDPVELEGKAACSVN